MTHAAIIAVPRLMTSQEQATSDSQLDRLVDIAFVTDAGEQEHVLARFFLDDVDHVVDGDHSDQPSVAVHDCRGHERIFLESQRDVFLVHVDRDERSVRAP